jgi:drug/metabolite transporter (DMT)-like permease
MEPVSRIARATQTPIALGALLVSGVIWGMSWLPLKYMAGLGLTGQLLGLTAYGLVTLIALPVIWRERSAWKPETGLLLLIGLFFGWANFAHTTALMSGSVVRVSLLFFMLPAWGAIGGALFLDEPLTPRRLLAVALSLVGVFVILGGTNVFREPLSMADGLALTAGMGFTAAGIVNRKARVIPIASRTFVSLVGCTVWSIALILFSTPSFPAMTAALGIAVTVFALVWLIGGTMITTYGVTHVEASRASILQVFELTVAVFSVILLTDETLTLKEWSGAALILSAAALEATYSATPRIVAVPNA